MVVLCGEVMNLSEVLNNYGLGGMALQQALVRLVAEHDADAYLPLFNGQFLLLAEWGETGERMIATDRFGTMNLFYVLHDERVEFFDTLWDLPNPRSMGIAPDHIISSMLFGYHVGKNTWLQDVWQTEPGRIYRVKGTRVSEKRYWRFRYRDHPEISFTDASQKLHDRWMSAVERWTKSAGDRLLVPLSGGLDSRAILAALMELGCDRNVTTCTWGAKGTFDFEIGGIVARVAGTRHINLPVDHADWRRQIALTVEDSQGMISCLPYLPILHYQELLRDYSQVVIGYMGDPIMGSHLAGNMLDRNAPSVEDLVECVAEKHFWSPVTLENVADVVGHPVRERQVQLITDTFDQERPEKLSEFCESWDFHERQHKYTLYAVMKFSGFARYRTPFVDNDIVDFMASMPLQWRYQQRLYTNFLSVFYPGLFRLPTKNRLGAPLTWAPWQENVYRFAYRGARSVKRRFFRRPAIASDVSNYLDYGRYLSFSPDLTNSLATWVGSSDAIARGQQFVSWQQALRGSSAHLVPLVMAITSQMAIAHLHSISDSRDED
jgi:asparagine synthase (glutamine-hydrolysing)